MKPVLRVEPEVTGWTTEEVLVHRPGPAHFAIGSCLDHPVAKHLTPRKLLDGPVHDEVTAVGWDDVVMKRLQVQLLDLTEVLACSLQHHMAVDQVLPGGRHVEHRPCRMEFGGAIDQTDKTVVDRPGEPHGPTELYGLPSKIVRQAPTPVCALIKTTEGVRQRWRSTAGMGVQCGLPPSGAEGMCRRRARTTSGAPSRTSTLAPFEATAPDRPEGDPCRRRSVATVRDNRAVGGIAPHPPGT